MFIQTELTPNPKTVKFIPGEKVSPEKSLSIGKEDDLDVSPLAKRLFLIDGISNVFLGDDFISITKDDSIEWQVIKPLILSQIMQHYMSDESVVEEVVTKDTKEINAQDKEIADQIEELLETRVRPSVAGHGGNIIFHSYADGVVELEMQGACSGCPSSMATLKMGVENMLKHYIPEVMEVKEVV
tara:strand:- start:28866 stop:29420 length:555 start_codon:yes stop_codon:yes gene_type:complete